MNPTDNNNAGSGSEKNYDAAAGKSYVATIDNLCMHVAIAIYISAIV